MDFSGVGLVVAPTGEPERSGGRGDPSTRFQIASVSKTFAAAVALMLVDRGALRLDDEVPPWPGVTVHHLLCHTSGLGHWAEMAGIDLATGRISRDLIRQSSLLTEPGARWRYSSPGYILLGELIERAAGKPYAQVLGDLLLEPLGLRDTVAGVRPTERVADGHRDGKPVREWDLSAQAGTGDVWSTVGDLTRFALGLDRDILARMRQPRAKLPEHDDIVTDYGYGLYLGDRWALHTGDNPGFRSVLAWLPDGRVAAALCNDETGPGPYEAIRALT
ncbi:serine hydrolase [Asanoa sp. WMMD1127]|uniref:serine hydrolase domain-containing protein n=1 Tax=Asanoa sp. WMMD1127 TaxID=3016107 RepID=UPI002415DA3F|nr:serine hydrolase domain-containing protein [Asanoa sp. WMMD1127]MDG4821777.1 serine hydrolase [Asanoa sp. WMMD1127]